MIDQGVKDLKDVILFSVVDHYLCVVFFLTHPHILVSVAPCVDWDSVCLWVLELPC